MHATLILYKDYVACRFKKCIYLLFDNCNYSEYKKDQIQSLNSYKVKKLYIATSRWCWMGG